MEYEEGWIFCSFPGKVQVEKILKMENYLHVSANVDKTCISKTKCFRVPWVFGIQKKCLIWGPSSNVILDSALTYFAHSLLIAI